MLAEYRIHYYEKRIILNIFRHFGFGFVYHPKVFKVSHDVTLPMVISMIF